MKTGVVLAAGKGSRAWPYAVVRPKVMIPIANRPLVSYSVEAMKAAGVARIAVDGPAELVQLAPQVEPMPQAPPAAEADPRGRTRPPRSLGLARRTRCRSPA